MSLYRRLNVGLVSKVVDPDQLLDECFKLADEISIFSLPAIVMGKDAVNKSLEMGLAQGLDYERSLFHATFALVLASVHKLHLICSILGGSPRGNGCLFGQEEAKYRGQVVCQFHYCTGFSKSQPLPLGTSNRGRTRISSDYPQALAPPRGPLSP